MNFKKLVAAFGAALVLACGGGGNGGGPTVSQLPALDKKVEVTFWHALSGNLAKGLTTMTDQYNSSQSNVHVTLQAKGSYSDLRKALLTALAAGSPPDMAQCIENHAAKYQQSNALADLSPYIDAKDGLTDADKKDIFPVMLNDAKLNGKYYMFPFNKSTTVLYYNQDMFTAKGISGPPASWDDFFTDVHKLADPAKGVVGAEAPSVDAWIGMLYEYGGKLYDNDSSPKKAAFNGDAGVKVTKMWQDAIKAGDARPVGTASFADQVDFQNQKTAMYISTQVSYQFITGPIGNKFKFAEAPFPSGSGGVKDEMFGANVCVFSKSAQDVQHGAFLYAKYMTNTENTTNWAKTTSYLPIRQSAYRNLQADFYSSNPSQGVGAGMLTKGQLFLVPFTPTFDDQRDAMTNELTNVWQQRKEPKAALDAAAQKVTDILTTG
jgi:multiple sugar transport system substrate-binding protein